MPIVARVLELHLHWMLTLSVHSQGVEGNRCV